MLAVGVDGHDAGESARKENAEGGVEGGSLATIVGKGVDLRAGCSGGVCRAVVRSIVDDEDVRDDGERMIDHQPDGMDGLIRGNGDGDSPHMCSNSSHDAAPPDARLVVNVT